MSPALQRAKRRFSQALNGLEHFASEFLHGIQSGFGNIYRPALSPREVEQMASWMNDEAFSSRNREFEFEATRPDGTRGTFSTTINNLLLIEPSYDTAKNNIRATLDRLEHDGIISRTPPYGNLRMVRQPGDTNATLRAGNLVCCPHDTRVTTGLWADFPPYGGITNGHLNQPEQAIGFIQPGQASIPGVPTPRQWVKYYPGAKFFEGNPDGRGNGWTFSKEAFIATLHELCTDMALLVKGANGNIEWHAGFLAFNNGSQFPTSMYPPNITGFAYDDCSPQYQYKADHRYCTTTQGARGTATGILIRGESDSLWLESANLRQRVARAENHQMLTSNDWGRIDVADCVKDFFALINAASFMIDVGATTHVHCCAETHNAIANKAMRELGMPVGSELDRQVRREREARAVRRRTTRAEALNAFQAALQRQNDEEVAAAEQSAMDFLNGGMTCTAQLFKVSPIAAGVCALVTAIASAMIFLFGGGLSERRTPERVLVRGGNVRVRPYDESDDTIGDIYGGYLYPWTREFAIRGIPVIRAKDASGRIYE